MTHSTKATERESSAWAWHPNLPLPAAPVWVWPPQPVNAAKYLIGEGFVWSTASLFVSLAVLSWFVLLPTADQWASLAWEWVLQVLAVNTALMVFVAGGLHWRLYTRRHQGQNKKFEDRDLSHSSAKFLFNNQVHDNVFWSLVSGIPICTAMQVIVMWAYANGVAPWLYWSDHPILFVLAFPLIAMWSSMHFYWIHRLIHWPPLFKRVHALHHRNINIGPWSGISMHPVEHFLYFSTIFVHLVVATHPIHLFYHVYLQFLSPPCTHSGFSELTVKGRKLVSLGDFFHQLHHRYFDCNYGTAIMPWDRWFGSFHDGTEAATSRVREYQRQRRGTA
ncbi:MAG: sterol desaturase family protein [Pseudomonadota bacterium]